MHALTVSFSVHINTCLMLVVVACISGVPVFFNYLSGLLFDVYIVLNASLANLASQLCLVSEIYHIPFKLSA